MICIANLKIAPPVFSFDEVVSPYMAVFFAAFLVALASTPVMVWVARRLGIVDRPDYRKTHLAPMAYLGGIALFLGWCAGLLVSLSLRPHTSAQPGGENSVDVPFAIILGAAIITIAGAWDDAKVIRARYKLLAQAAAGAVLYFGDIGGRIVPGALISLCGFLGISMHIPDWVLAPVSLALVIIFVTGACNATNLIDGLDGLAAGVSAMATIGFGTIATCLAMGVYVGGGVYSVTMDPVRVVMCLAMLGSIMGFLPYNFKPACIFMGDAGSNLLGFLCITSILLLGEKGDPLLVMAGLTIFALPIMDTGLAIVRRLVRRMSIAAPDRHHLHHLLVRSGMGVRRAMLMLCLMAMAFSVLGCAMVFIRLRYVAAIFAVIFSFAAITAFKVGHRLSLEEQAAAGAAPPGVTTATAADRTPSPVDVQSHPIEVG